MNADTLVRGGAGTTLAWLLLAGIGLSRGVLLVPAVVAALWIVCAAGARRTLGRRRTRRARWNHWNHVALPIALCCVVALLPSEQQPSEPRPSAADTLWFAAPPPTPAESSWGGLMVEEDADDPRGSAVPVTGPERLRPFLDVLTRTGLAVREVFHSAGPDGDAYPSPPGAAAAHVELEQVESRFVDDPAYQQAAGRSASLVGTDTTGIRPGDVLLDDPFEILRLRREQEWVEGPSVFRQTPNGETYVALAPPALIPSVAPDVPEVLDMQPTLVHLAPGVDVLEVLVFDVGHARRGEVRYVLLGLRAVGAFLPDLEPLRERFRTSVRIPAWEWRQTLIARFVLLGPAVSDPETELVEALAIEFLRPR